MEAPSATRMRAQTLRSTPTLLRQAEGAATGSAATCATSFPSPVGKGPISGSLATERSSLAGLRSGGFTQPAAGPRTRDFEPEFPTCKVGMITAPITRCVRKALRKRTPRSPRTSAPKAAGQGGALLPRGAHPRPRPGPRPRSRRGAAAGRGGAAWQGGIAPWETAH